MEGSEEKCTVGGYLAKRLLEIGVEHVFAVAGDYNLSLLDQLLANKDLKQVYSSNELNCGFSAEGYARARGAGCAVVTFSVGGLSALSALAGAYAEDLPLILVSGAPNTNDLCTDRVVHHSLGTADLTYQLEAARRLTCAAAAVVAPSQAPEVIDGLLREALRQRKPVYLEVACNVAALPCPPPGPASAVTRAPPGDEASLAAAVAAAAEYVAALGRPMLLLGPRLRSAGAVEAAAGLAEAMGCAVAVQAAAKGLFPEAHPQYAGVFWGVAGEARARALADWADGVLCLGTLFSDYSTAGWTAEPPPEARLLVEPDCVRWAGRHFGRVPAATFLAALAAAVPRRDASAQELRRLAGPGPAPEPPEDEELPLRRVEMARQLEAQLDARSTVFADTGEAWFTGLALALPSGARFETAMQWGHIGWALPAAFGYGVGAPDRRVLVLIGDGAIQVTVQALGQMGRLGQGALVVVLNNGGYAIEAALHAGPYNEVAAWRFAALPAALCPPAASGLRAATAAQLAAALRSAPAARPALLECLLHPDDCSPALISWAALVAKANSRPPK